MNEPLEIEVKYLLTNTPEIRGRIINAGWQSFGRNFESNIRFDDDENNLEKKQQLLRLRQDKISTLTFKSKVPSDDTRYKILKELEVTVDSFDTMRAILAALGLREKQVYEKWRETFKKGNALICLDEMPFADFIEIEAGKDDIDFISKHFGFSPSKAITANYLQIFSLIRKQANLDFTDVTFDNFNDLKRDFHDLIRTFEAASTSLPSSP